MSTKLQNASIARPSPRSLSVARYRSEAMRWLLAFAVAGLMTAGCAIYEASYPYRGAYLKANPNLDPAIRKDIEENRIRVGMDRYQVLAAWGGPRDRVQYDDGTEIWTYEMYDQDAISAFQKVTTLYFDAQGRLDRMSSVKMN